MADRVPPPPPPPGSGRLPTPSTPTGLGAPTVQKRKIRIGTPVVVLLAVLAATAAYLAVTRTLDQQPPTEAEVTASFANLPGYQYGDMPPEALAGLEDAFKSQAGEQAVAHFDARQVSRSGEPVAVVFVLSIDPDDMEGDFEDEYVAGFTSTSQATVEDIQIGGTMGHIAVTPLGTIAFFFDQDGLVFNVVGRDNPTVEGLARTLEAANS